MSLRTEELQSLREGTWHLDCPTLRLTRRSKTKPHSLSGAGTIYLSPDHIFFLKLYGSRREDQQKRLKEMFEEAREVPAGSLRPEDSYYNLEAVDSSGRRWVAKRLRPRITHTATDKPIAEAELPSLQMVTDIRQRSAGRSLVLYVLEDVEIPTNSIVREDTSIAAGTRREKRYTWDAWKFRACKIDFLFVRRKHKELEIHAATEVAATTFLRDRITEAVQFLLGRPLPWSVSMELRSGKWVTELRSRVWLPPNARHRPPLQPLSIIEEKDSRTVSTTRHHRKLFERFLRHTLDLDELRHPLWGDLNAVYEASAGKFIDAQALTLTVVIEAMLARDFSVLGETSAELRQGIQEVRRLLEQSNLSLEIKNRIKGILGQLLGTNAVSRLRVLEQKGAITKSQRDAWHELRNASTHAYQSPRLSSERLRELLRINEVLLTHLVFCTIGYRGLYTDYSSLGWPNRLYEAERPQG